MIKDILKHLVVVILCCFFMCSCTKDVDFNQAKDLTLEPIIASDLIFFDTPASSFFVDGTELNTIRDSVIIDLFSRDFVVDNLVKADFVFETTNSINRAFSVQIDFLDATDLQQHSFTVSALASPTNTDVVTLHTEIFEGNLLNALKATNKVVLTIQALSGGSSLNDTTPGRIQLKSKGIFYLKIEGSE